MVYAGVVELVGNQRRASLQTKPNQRKDAKMHIHRDVSDIVNGTVLRDVFQIHGMEIPYPAELWVDGTRYHEDGTAMFNVGDKGYLTAEYFSYDAANPLEWLDTGFKRLDAQADYEKHTGRNTDLVDQQQLESPNLA